MLILLEWAVVAQCPCDPRWPPPGCRAVTGITTWSSEEEKQKGSFVLYTARVLYAGLLAQLGGLFMFNVLISE